MQLLFEGGYYLRMPLDINEGYRANHTTKQTHYLQLFTMQRLINSMCTPSALLSGENCHCKQTTVVL